MPKETVPVPALGGDVVVRGLMLSERLGLYASRAGRDGKALLDVPEILALCASRRRWLAVFDVTEWDAFGIKHGEAALQLFNVALVRVGRGGRQKTDRAEFRFRLYWHAPSGGLCRNLKTA